MKQDYSLDIWRSVNGALKAMLEEHGTITKKNYGSAGKRIAGQIETMIHNQIRKHIQENETLPIP